MQRTPLKRVPMARKGLKRPLGAQRKRRKTTDLAKLKKELWELCKQIIRKRYGNTCYTCEAEGLAGANWHTGHFIPSSVCGTYLRWDLRNLRPQCFRCNISLVGNGSSFYRELLIREGVSYLDQLFADKEKLTKLTPAFLQQKIEEYKTIVESQTNQESQEQSD